MKHKVTRKARDVAIFGYSEATLCATIPILVTSPFPGIDICSQSKSYAAQTFVKRRYHHSHAAHSKEHSKKVSPPIKELAQKQYFRTKYDVIFFNRVICTHKLYMQNYYRREHLQSLLDKDAELFFILMFCSDRLSDEEFKKGLAAYVKLQRRCKDCFLAYQDFLKRNSSVFTFGRFVPETAVPETHLLPSHQFCFKPSDEKYRSFKNKKKKNSRYLKKARKNKEIQRNFFMNEWISEDSFEEDELVTFADVYEGMYKYPEFTQTEKAYQAFINAPCTVEAAWAIHDGTEFEHADEIDEAYQLLSNYLNALYEEV